MGSIRVAKWLLLLPTDREVADSNPTRSWVQFMTMLFLCTHSFILTLLSSFCMSLTKMVISVKAFSRSSKPYYCFSVDSAQNFHQLLNLTGSLFLNMCIIWCAFSPFIPTDPYRYLCKQCRSRWDGSLRAVSSGSTLFATLLLSFDWNPYSQQWMCPNSEMEEFVSET